MRVEQRFVVPASHPALPGHFPGNPVVPGVLLIEAVDDLLRQSHRRLIGVSSFKFLRVVRPGETLAIQLDAETLDEGKAELTALDGQPVARGRWRAGAL